MFFSSYPTPTAATGANAKGTLFNVCHMLLLNSAKARDQWITLAQMRRVWAAIPRGEAALYRVVCAWIADTAESSRYAHLE